ncbi:hypothetical protein Tco_1051444, partial [Tanacetum coccineum]
VQRIENEAKTMKLGKMVNLGRPRALLGRSRVRFSPSALFSFINLAGSELGSRSGGRLGKGSEEAWDLLGIPEPTNL